MNYSRGLANMALYFKCDPTSLEEEQILDYLHLLKSQKHKPSSSYFKHTVYGLKFAYKVLGIRGKNVFLRQIKHPKKLPVVLSQQEIARLIRTPTLLKHRILIALLYGCGLRRAELLNLKIIDINLDRQMLHVRQGKGSKDRYLPIGDVLARGIKTYLLAEKPNTWLFNGTRASRQELQFSATGTQWIIRQACKKAGITQKVSSHTLRHTYATHLLEMGLDIITLKELLGHVDIHTTMIYLHVAKTGRSNAFSPLDKVFNFSKP